MIKGSFYEINHAKLPSDAPAVLYSLRAVMVTGNTEQNVTIRYPSLQSLQAFFAKADRLAMRLKLYPATDEKYVMEPKLAVEVLGHQIPTEEFLEHRHSKSFWLINCFKTEELGLPASHAASGSNAKDGTCFSTLQRCGMKWGFRQTQIVRSCIVKQLDEADEAMSALSHGDVKDIEEVIVKDEEMHEVEVKLEEMHEIKVELEETPDIKLKDIIAYSRKRKRARPIRSQYLKTKRIPKPKPLETLSNIVKTEGDHVERWSVMRYEASIKDLVEVLKINKAFHGHPISRATLRTEARKRIGDTGLLDHLLKHLAGKVVPSGGDVRLRRRCDSSGTMEYWLESADLVNIRRDAGVQDPYWIPPPGWKKGDCITSHNCICCEEVRLLKDELNSLRRKEAELKLKEDKQQTITVALPESEACSGRFNRAKLHVTNFKMKDSYELMVKKKSVMEEQLHKLSKALIEVEDDMKKFSSPTEAKANQKPLMISFPKSLTAEEMNEKNSTTTTTSSTEDLLEETSVKSSETDDEAFDRDSEATKRARALRLPKNRTPDAAKIISVTTPPTASPHSTTTS